MDPVATFEALQADPEAQLIDVRTQAEWLFVGVPDLSAIGRQPWMLEWQSFPGMAVNPAFLSALDSRVEAQAPTKLFFICRSGARSMRAAMAAATSPIIGDRALFNVAEGFEGDLDAERRRATINGWQARGLPWVQS
jgi:rhodanese-related sulfurtransferase